MPVADHTLNAEDGADDSGETCRQVGAAIAFKRGSAATVKGRDEPIQTFSPRAHER